VERFFSRIQKEELIFSILKREQITEKRIDVSPDKEYMQVCGRIMNHGFNVAPHKHLKIHRETTLTQESWVVLKGKVRASFYDVDDTFLCDRIIESGDVVVFYRGGHSLEVLDDGTIFYEFKNGPYYGVSEDKVDIS